jgi:hypothetical protein
MTAPTPPALQLPHAFELSYRDFESYPSNLICQTSYLYAIKASKERLDAAAPKLFTSQDGEVEVPFRESLLSGVGRFRADSRCDWYADLQAFQKRNILNDDKLKKWLGDTTTVNSATQAPEGSLATQRDPKCRFM